MCIRDRATEELSLTNGTVYLQIQMAGFVLMALTTTITAVLRGVGDSKTAKMCIRDSL